MNTLTKNVVLINSIAELIELSQNQVTFQEVINGRLYIKNLGWTNVEFESDFKDKLCKEVADTLGGQVKTRHSVYLTLKYGRPQHWGLNRVLFEPLINKFKYCAGQDYISETQTIRNFLKR